jgi:hypothetical protein
MHREIRSMVKYGRKKHPVSQEQYTEWLDEKPEDSSSIPHLCMMLVTPPENMLLLISLTME